MSNIMYISTRDTKNRVTASQAILKGISQEGGLFVPENIPTIDLDWNVLKNQSYQEIAQKVLSVFLSDFTQEEIRECVTRAYDQKFDDQKIAPLHYLNENIYLLELFHGNTIAFKDMALSILPYLMTTAAKKNKLKEKIAILTATSGDTGKAAMAGFADVDGTKIIVFYPKDGVSNIQRQQMITQPGDNVKVVAIEGNFDDAQTEVKKMFQDQQLKQILLERGYVLSSANSINIGRLVPQIVYYVYAYAQLVKENRIENGRTIDIAVPTGNFGNILAAYYAKKIGVPIGKLICAANRNNVLVDFFNSGQYNAKREFYLTSSPSMDILVSSNLERLIYFLVDEQDQIVNQLMKELSNKGIYQIEKQLLDKSTEFYANQADDAETQATIRKVYEEDHYVMDPHTAVAYTVVNKYRNYSQSTNPTIIAATASPYKFSETVVAALTGEKGHSEVQLMKKLKDLSNVSIPEAVSQIMSQPVLHQSEVMIEDMKQSVLTFLVKE